MFILTESNGHNNWSINVLNIDVEESRLKNSDVIFKKHRIENYVLSIIKIFYSIVYLNS